MVRHEEAGGLWFLWTSICLSLAFPLHVVFRCVRTVLGGQLFLGQSQHGRLEVDGLRTAFNIEGVYGYRVDVARMQAAYGKAGYR